MSKKLMVSALALAFLVGSASIGFAAKVKCTVSSVDGEKVTMECTGADDLKAGDAVEVKVKGAKKGKAIEGC